MPSVTKDFNSRTFASPYFRCDLIAGMQHDQPQNEWPLIGAIWQLKDLHPIAEARQ